MAGRESLLREITDAFLGSNDFNGIPIAALMSKLGLKWPVVKDHLIELVGEERVGVLFGDTDVNPHIIRFGFEPVEVQLEKLEGAGDLSRACVYPRPNHLREVVDPAVYHDRPYTLALMMGKPQLSYRAFDLSVLEVYRSDPRYRYETNDIGGSISVHDEYFESEHLLERDRVLLQTFGFAYDPQMRRAVAVFLRYLADLSPEHQQIWRARQLAGDFKLHPDYYRNSILGDWGERESIFSALLIELHVINKMAESMGRPPLFRKDFGPYAEKRPRQLAFLLRPTRAEFNAFFCFSTRYCQTTSTRPFSATRCHLKLRRNVPTAWSACAPGARSRCSMTGSVRSFALPIGQTGTKASWPCVRSANYDRNRRMPLMRTCSTRSTSRNSANS
jgi:hypothetical protein